MIGVVLSLPAWIAGRRLSTVPLASEEVQSTTAAELFAPRRSERKLGRENEAKGKRFNATEWRKAIAHWKTIRSVTRQRVGIFELARAVDLQDFSAAIMALETEKATREEAALIMRARMYLFELWADRDLASARAWLQVRTERKERHQLCAALGPVWARQDPESLLHWVESESPADGKSMLQPDAIRLLAETDAARTLALLIAQQGPPAEQFANQVWRIWAERDPRAAAARALHLLSGGSFAKQVAVSSVVTGWTKGDPAAVKTWIATLDDPAIAEIAWPAFVEELAARDPATAVHALADDVPSNLRQSLAARIAAVSANNDPETVLSFARDEANADVRGIFAHAAIARIAESDPVRAADLWLQENIESGAPLPQDAKIIAENLALKNGVNAFFDFLKRVPPEFSALAEQCLEGFAEAKGWAAAGEMTLALPASARRENWLERSIEKQVAEGDVTVAQSFVARTTPGTERVIATRSFATALFPTDANAAAEALLKLSDGRAELLHATEEWISKDPVGAARWIRTTAQLSAVEKQQLALDSPSAVGGSK
jgi:hypothetical protein